MLNPAQLAAAVLALAGVAKIVRRDAFQRALRSGILHESPKGAAFLSRALPPYEIVLGSALFVKPSIRGLALLTALTSGGFAAILTWLLRRDPASTCRCFGWNQRVGWHMPLRNAGLAALAAAGTAA